MKVKCKEFEGTLISINSEIEIASVLHNNKDYVYIIKIALSARQ